ncbi:MAG TPA: Crp/Fnr family transcriptional regulator [Chromatiales bacterium]|nr:Crp/Fnr family transcriptional regulator [Thiotrichales bacterium]HIP69589.1 Crp/Fnr family transcriptional regulator [Chromatiales bacterium]
MDTAWLNKNFPELERIQDDAGKKILATAKLASIPQGTILFQPGDPCRQYLLACEGSIKVQQTSEDGREIVLYRVQNGESCVLTTTCLLAGENYSATGIAETHVEAIAIPAQQFQQGLNDSPGLRKFIFDNYNQRLGELLQLVKSLAFAPLESRLANRLLQQADADNRISMTHQALAADLGCTREVISRRLKEFEHLGWVKLHRGQIEVLDKDALQQLKKT